MSLLGFAALTPTYTLQPTHYFWPWFNPAKSSLECVGLVTH